jgi:hypothetical protein
MTRTPAVMMDRRKNTGGLEGKEKGRAIVGLSVVSGKRYKGAYRGKPLKV